MRSFSWLIILLALIISWDQFASRDVLSWKKQYSVQLGLREFITDYIRNELPQAKNIRFRSVWSEIVQEGKVRVHFDYFFDHPTETDMTRMELKGSALLNQIAGDADGGWSLEDVAINNESLVFRDGSLIVRDGKSPDEMPDETTESNTEEDN